MTENKLKSKTDFRKSKSNKTLFVSQGTLRRTHEYFFPYFQSGVETACYWFGIDTSKEQIVLAIGVPKLIQTSGNFMVEMNSMRQLSSEMRRQGLTSLAQIHTHPPICSVKHSLFDDARAYSTKDGALSLVWANYGLKLDFTLQDIGVHEIQNGEWVFLNPREIQNRIRIINDFADFRWQIDNSWIKNEE